MQAIRFLFAFLVLVGTLVNVQLHVNAKEQPGLTNYANTPAAVKGSLHEEWQLNSRTGPSSVATASGIGIEQTQRRMQTRPNHRLIKRTGGNDQGQSASTDHSPLPPTTPQDIEGYQQHEWFLKQRDEEILKLLAHLVPYFDRSPSLNLRRLFLPTLINDLDLLGLVLFEARHALQRQSSLYAGNWAWQVAKAENAYNGLASRLRESPNSELRRQETAFVADLDATLTRLLSPNEDERAQARDLLKDMDTNDFLIERLVSRIRKLGTSATNPHVISGFVPTPLNEADRLALKQIGRTAELSKGLAFMVREADANNVLDPRSMPRFHEAERMARELMSDIEAGAKTLKSLRHPAHLIGEPVVQRLKDFLKI